MTAEQGFEKIAEAREVFFAGLGTSKAVPVEDIDYDNLPVKEQLIGLAFEAYNSGNDEKLISYMKEQNLYEQYLQIEKDYGLDEANEAIAEKRGMSAESRAVSTSFFNNVANGEILLTIDASGSGSIVGVLIPGTWKHAGMWSTLQQRSYSISDFTGTKVGFETIPYLTGKKYLSVWRPKAYTAARATGAVTFAHTQLGKPFDFFKGRSDFSAYYCSKLVWKSWLTQGINLEVIRWFDPWVTPNDLAYDGKTTFIRGDYIYPRP